MFDGLPFEKVGKHEVCLVGDIVYCRWHGSLEVDDVSQYVAYMRGRLGETTRLYQLMDMTGLTEIPAATRKAIADVTREIPLVGFAGIGGTFALQVVARLLVTAMAIFKKQEFQIVFVKTREDAERWVADQRSKTT